MERTDTRYIEIDLLRTLALAMMVVYHIAFDLDYMYGWPVLRSLGVGGWLLARATATLFLLLVGIGFAISWDRRPIYRRQAIRGAKILTAAALVSIATYMFDPPAYVRFGVLHLIGTATFLLPFFAPLKEWNALVGIVIIALGKFIAGATAQTSFLLPLGIPPQDFTTLDYFPLLPWLGVILIGIGVGHFFYIRNLHWRQLLPEQSPILQSLAWPGRYSLLMYLLHQPILLLALQLLLH